MAIYTRQGDTGKTGLIGSQTTKSDLRIHVVGQLDEVMVLLGQLMSGFEEEACAEISDLEMIYRYLFTIQTIIVDMNGQYGLTTPEVAIEFLEQKIDEMEIQLPKLKNFIYYMGHPLSLLSQHIRVNIRSVERLVVELNERETVPETVLKFLNRLSDYFYTLGRFINKQKNYEEKVMKL